MNVIDIVDGPIFRYFFVLGMKEQVFLLIYEYMLSYEGSLEKKIVDFFYLFVGFFCFFFNS